MASVSLKDKNFDFSDLAAAMVVAEVHDNQSAISVFSFDRNQFVSIDVFEDDSELATFSKSPLLSAVAKQKLLSLSVGKTLLVPSALFDDGKTVDLFRFNFEDFLEETEKVFFNKLNHLNAYLLFSVKRDVVKLLSPFFKEQDFFHTASGFLETCVLFQNERLKNKDKPVIFVDVLGDSILLSLFDSGKLAFFNQIAFKQPQDFVFFLVKLADEFKLDTKKVELFLSGRVDFPKGKISQEIKKFFLQVYPFEFTKFFGVSPALKPIPLYRTNSLFNFPFCVS